MSIVAPPVTDIPMLQARTLQALQVTNYERERRLMGTRRISLNRDGHG